eukprot:m.407352 g.407352  ORF g.407352 m.407352 type:complete len:54 (+) comp56505_c0_seq21:3571-3732(+)
MARVSRVSELQKVDNSLSRHQQVQFTLGNLMDPQQLATALRVRVHSALWYSVC